MNMQLSELLKPWIANIDESILITGIQSDSRKVKVGDCFFALKGVFEYGQKYIDEAIQNGAVAVIYEAHMPLNLSIPSFHLPALAQNLGKIACRFYDYPAKQLNAIGVTGTNGKTTIAYLLTQAYTQLADKAFYIGTLGVGPVGAIHETGMTTPGPIDLQRMCHEYSSQAYQQLVMEVSSHALDQYRIDGIPFKQAIFTNLTHDHLDYHGTMDAYAKAKARLFSWPNLETIIVNADDPMHALMLKNVTPQAKIYRTAIYHPADIKVISQSWSLNGMHLDLQTPWGNAHLESSLLGEFNVYNILAVFTSLMDNGFSLSAVQSIIANLKPPPGRMEVVSKKPLVIVDYAHTPAALENVLLTLKHFQSKTQAGALWVVFGCGGDRDPYKRPEMGKIAENLADSIVITSDNPRTEAPLSIINQVLKGIRFPNQVIQIEDRKLAILSALEDAKPEDIILIAGKGHEDYQLIGQEKFYFSDKEVVENYMQQTFKIDKS
jgi:UDP-N-acetylmuramoyl-L-alanyl-D-glutamate--2,6-diaminopimelate ligase